MTFAKRFDQIKTSATLKAKQKALELAARGIKVINLSAGEPSFQTPEKIKEACKKALDENETLYGPANGLLKLREAISQKIMRDQGFRVSPENIVVSCGAKQGIFAALQVLINGGDEVLLPSPYWVSYPPQIRLAQGEPVILYTSEETDFKITPEQLKKAITPKTKLLILNTPSNPTGACYDAAELATIGRICLEKDIWVLSDEIYEHLTYDGFHQTSFLKACPEQEARTILVSGASKAFAMTGWRMGYVVGPREFTEKMKILQGQEITSIPTFIQHACVTAYSECDAEIRKMRDAYEERRNLILRKVSEIPGVQCFKPRGAFYIFPNLSSFKKPTEELADYLLGEAHVSVIAGDSFGSPGNLRISFVNDLKAIEEGMDKIKEALAKL